MEYHTFKDDVSIYQSNARAEDAPTKRTHWDALCEGVFIPLGSLFLVFLTMLGMMLIID